MTTYALDTVLEFYKQLPFNFRGSIEAQAQKDVAVNPLDTHPALAEVFRPGMKVLDCGCGAGWFANSLAHNNTADVTAIDFNPVAIERAQAVGTALALQNRYHVQDLFTYEPTEKFDLVWSMGVLHHTGNCDAAVRHVCRSLVKKGGHVYIGLYHTFGRRPFLDHFEQMKQKGADEETLYAHYRELHKNIDDETMLRSWFRDQVLHPHETQHTQGEMNTLLEEEGMELVASSINRFQPFQSQDELVAAEKGYEDLANDYLQKNIYFPGFFIFLAKKP